MNNIHHINDVTFVSSNLQQSLFEEGKPYLWASDYYSGRPLFAQPEYYFLDLHFLMILIFRDIFVAMNLTTIGYFFLAAVGMYFVFLQFHPSKQAATIAALIYVLNGYMHLFVRPGNLNVMAGYALLPISFYFYVKALKQKQWVGAALAAGVGIGMLLLAGASLFIGYAMVLFAVYGLIHCIGARFVGKAIKVALVAVLTGIVAFGVAAIKLLPGKTFVDLSNRGAGINYQQYLGNPIEFGNFLEIFVSSVFHDGGITMFLGFAGFVLLLLGFSQWKKKYILFAIALFGLSVLMAAETFVSQFFFEIPVFNQLRHIERALLLTAFASALLAGTGFVVAQQKWGGNDAKNRVLFFVLGAIVVVELLILQPFPMSIEITRGEDIPINAHIAQDDSHFRTINLGLNDIIGGSGYNFMTQLDIGTIKGGSGIWFNEYVIFLQLAQQNNPAKLWGMLNNKYVLSRDNLSIPGLEYVDSFETCGDCPMFESWGPHLYRNTLQVPRAYTTDNAVLVIGSGENQRQMIYSLLLTPSFDPNKAVIVTGFDQPEKHSIDELQQYKAIIITQQISQAGLNALAQYVERGGKVLPDFINGQNTFLPEDVNALFGSMNKTVEPVEISHYYNNEIQYVVDGKPHFLVLSERFSQFDGWKTMGFDAPIRRANAVVSAIPLTGQTNIVLKYSPGDYVLGRNITIVTALLLFAFVGYSIFRKGGRNKTEE